MKNGIAGVIIVLILLFSSAANSLALDPAWKSVVRGRESYLGSRGFLWNGIVTEGGDRHYHLGVDIIASEGEEIYPELKTYCQKEQLSCPEISTIGRIIKDLGGLRLYPQKISHFGKIKPLKRQKN